MATAKTSIQARLPDSIIANIVELYRWRGTIRGLVAELAIYTGGDVEISESGGAAWSLTPGTDPPVSGQCPVLERYAQSRPR